MNTSQISDETDHQVIPEAAVEAAQERAFEYDGWRPDAHYVRELLEAAAPHMLASDRADIWDEGNLAGKEATCRFERTNPYRPAK